MNNYQIHFRSAQNSLPSEIQTRIDKNDDNSKINITQGNYGYSWAKIGKRIVIWRYDKLLHQNQINFHEISIPDKFFTKSIFLIPFSSKINQKSVCVFMTSSFGDLCFWPNVDAPSKFIESFINISPRKISSIILKNSNEFFIILSDESIIHILIDDKINTNFISTQGLIPKVLTTILSPFTRRTMNTSDKEILSTFKMDMDFDKNYCFICINTTQEIKVLKFSKTFPAILDQEKIVNRTNLKRMFMEDSKLNDFEQISFCGSINVKNYIYSLIEAYCVDIQEFKYFIYKIKFSNDLSVVDESLIQIDFTSFEKISKCLMCYSDSLRVILITIKERMLIFECNSKLAAPLKVQNSDGTPVSISYCKYSSEFLLMLDDMKFYYISQNADHSFNESLIRNTSVDFDRSSIQKTEISNQPPFTLPENPFDQLDYYFKKFITLQKNFPNSISNMKIQNADLITEISSYSDYLITNTNPDSDATSISRKLLYRIKNSENFFKFLKETNLIKQSLFYSGNSKEIKQSINIVLKNIERAKLSLLIYDASDQNSNFLRLFQEENSKILNSSLISGLIERVEEIFMNIISHTINLIEIMNKVDSKSMFEFICSIIIKSLDIFISTTSELKYFLKNKNEIEFLKEIQIEKSSFINNKEITNIYLDFLTFGVGYQKKLNLNNISDSLFTACQKFMESLQWFTINNLKCDNDYFPEIFNKIVQYFESNNYIDRAIEFAILFKNYHHVIRLCVEHKRMDVLHSLKQKLHDDNFDSKVSEWLAANKCWSLLSEQVNRGNIEEICQNIPHLSWIYFLKQKDYNNTLNSLKAIAQNEDNLYFQKTYCAMFRLCEIANEEKYDPEISYILNKIKYQINKKPFIFSDNVNEKVLSLQEILFNRLFSDDVVITQELIIKSLDLVAESKIENILKFITLVWSAAVLFDPYLKYNDTVMKSTCENNSFFYQSLKAVYENKFPPIFYDESLCIEIFSFINSTFDNPLSELFYQRIKCIFEIFQDTVVQNNSVS